MQALKRLFRKPRVGLTIAGGGCKAFFGLGVGHVLLQHGVPIKAISATSAGSAMALSLISGGSEQVIDYFCSITFQNESNFYLKKLLTFKRPFPHENMYRTTIASHTDFEKIQHTDIALAFNSIRLDEKFHPEKQRANFLRLIARLYTAYVKEFKNFEKRIYEPLLADIIDELELEEVVFRNDDLATPKQIENIILASSSAPPIVETQRMADGHFYLDGGLYNNLPITHLAGELDLVIAVYYEPMTRFFYDMRKDKRFKDVVFIAPPTRLPITTWDYTNPYGVRATFEMGKRAGELAMRRIKQLV